MDDRAVGLGESLEKERFNLHTPPSPPLSETFYLQGQSRGGNMLHPGWGPRLSPPQTRPFTLHSGRLPEPPELLVTKGPVRARGRHREQHNWKPAYGRHHQPITAGKQQQSSKLSDPMLPEHCREGRNPLPAIPRVPGNLPS